MKPSENLSKMKDLFHACVSDCEKFEEKGNFQASIRLRNNLSEIKKLCTETRALIKEERESVK
jgi:hypothetical protein